jgi:hypothetical protein
MARRSVPGASEQRRRVKVMNANWLAGEGEDGRFELVIITADDDGHVLAASSTAART